VAASADVGSFDGRLLLSVAAVAYAAVTGLTLYASGNVERRISPQAGMILDRVAGILLTSITVILLANGFTDLVVAALYRTDSCSLAALAEIDGPGWSGRAVYGRVFVAGSGLGHAGRQVRPDRLTWWALRCGWPTWP
jgi:hypothetical protein